MAFHLIELVEPVGPEFLELGDLAGGHFPVGTVGLRGAFQMELRPDAQQADEESLLLLGQRQARCEHHVDILPLLDQPLAALPGASEPGERLSWPFREAGGELFDLVLPVDVPAHRGTAGLMNPQRVFGLLALVDAQRVDHHVAELPLIVGRVDRVPDAPLVEPRFEGLGRVVGQDDALAGQAVLDGIPARPDLALLRRRPGRFPGILAVGVDLPLRGHGVVSSGSGSGGMVLCQVPSSPVAPAFTEPSGPPA
jgi:hypothetical protein